jgi:hypothetical protein
MQRRNFQTRGPQISFCLRPDRPDYSTCVCLSTPMSAHQVTTTPGERLKDLAPFGLGRIKPNRS